MPYLKERIRSFKYAFSGLKHLVVGEPNARIHLVAALLAVLLGFYLELDRTEWLWILLSIVLVITTEAINASIEALADAITEEYDEKIKIAKDLAAAATLIVAIFSLVVALFIFVPKLLV